MSSVLQNAGLEDGLVYWPKKTTTDVGIDCGEYEIAQNLIKALNGTVFNDCVLQARWHKDVGGFARSIIVFVCVLNLLDSRQIQPASGRRC